MRVRARRPQYMRVYPRILPHTAARIITKQLGNIAALLHLFPYIVQAALPSLLYCTFSAMSIRLMKHFTTILQQCCICLRMNSPATASLRAAHLSFPGFPAVSVASGSENSCTMA